MFLESGRSEEGPFFFFLFKELEHIYKGSKEPSAI